MAFLQINYFSQPLGMHQAMVAIVPNGGTAPFPVVYQLHGMSDDHTIWQRHTSIERYAESAQVAIVMLNGARSFYCNEARGMRWEQHILDSIHTAQRLLPICHTRAGRAIGGLSMGGYGAIKLAMKYPELFCSAWSHSGVLDLQASVSTNSFPEDFLRVFAGTLAAEDDCCAMARAWASADKKSRKSPARPALAFDCGVDDFLIQHNRDFHALLKKLKIPHHYEEHPGAHTWDYWDQHLPTALAAHVAQFRALGSLVSAKKSRS